MRLFSLVLRPATKPDPETEANRELVEFVRLEIFRNELEPALWSSALSWSGGVRETALVEYARLRVRQLSIERPPASRVFEGRLLKAGRRIRSAQDLLALVNRGDAGNLPKPKLSFAGLFLLMLGTSALAASASPLYAPRFLNQAELEVLPFTPLVGLVAVLFAMVSRAILPKARVRQDWNHWVAIVGILACIGSFCIGSKLIISESPELILQLLSLRD
ncbi:hypothetical protein OJ996_12935 [Luteolibacter sp. GHJ8]|jgi:hypothetical protein|uniref:Uncharacterized protein n=1 Tax=Luteolibacter rhizosphaerae TaxID=2989719 RepID=A0ABT3G3S5_9BACT|nr:hypothetical protein [Luteolibacter rhizosphaerae]MCW1914486.1 hypothetical protein [Luteolibacter rhizosphaerae]